MERKWKYIYPWCPQETVPSPRRQGGGRGQRGRHQPGGPDPADAHPHPDLHVHLQLGLRVRSDVPPPAIGQVQRQAGDQQPPHSLLRQGFILVRLLRISQEAGVQHRGRLPERLAAKLLQGEELQGEPPVAGPLLRQLQSFENLGRRSKSPKSAKQSP